MPCMTYLMLYVQPWTPDDGRKDRPKHVEWYSINSKNYASSWLYYRNISRCTVPWTSNSNYRPMIYDTFNSYHAPPGANPLGTTPTSHSECNGLESPTGHRLLGHGFCGFPQYILVNMTVPQTTSWPLPSSSNKWLDILVVWANDCR
jgi:hypothetical protein